MAARATTWLSGLAADTGLSGMAANTKTWLSGLAAVKHGSQDQHGPNFFSRNLPAALVLLRATALYLQEVQAAYGVSRVSYIEIQFRYLSTSAVNLSRQHHPSAQPASQPA